MNNLHLADLMLIKTKVELLDLKWELTKDTINDYITKLIEELTN
jgi:hypothetical protein